MATTTTRRLLDLPTCVWAAQALAQGQSLPHVARQLGVTAGTLRTALLRASWQAWCVQCEASGAPRPEAPSAVQPNARYQKQREEHSISWQRR